MTAFRIACVWSIVCLTLVAGWNHLSLGRANSPNTFRCPYEGFHPDPNDCRIFYRCVDWNSNVFFRDYNEPSLTPFQFSCGEGTVFDPEYNICNHPSQTSRKECGGREGNGGNGGGMTNNQYPFMYPSMMRVGEGYPTKSGYPGYPIQEVNTNYPESYPNDNENQNLASGEMVESTPGECSGEGFFPVPGDCNRFMRCTDDGMGSFKKFVFRCGEGTVWDQRNLVCNHPGSVPGCGGNQSGNGNGQYPDQGGHPEDGNPPGHPQGEYPGDYQQGNTQDQSGYPQENYPQQGGYPAADFRPPPENHGQPGSNPDQSGYQLQQGYPGQPNQGGYPIPANRPPPQNQGYLQQQGNSPPVNQQNQGNRPNQLEYPQQQGYPGQQNQGGYPTPATRPSGSNQGYPQLQGYRPPVNQQNQGNRPNQGQQNQGGTPATSSPGQNQGYPQQQSSKPPTNQQNQGNRPNQPGYPSPTDNQGQPGYPQQGGYQNEPGELYPQQGESPDEGNPLSGSPGDNITPASMGSANMCQSDGFFSVSGDCTKFYRCVDNGKGGYFRNDFTCGPNTVWDQEQTTCNHPWAVKRNDCSNIMTGGSYPDAQQPGSNQNPTQSTTTSPNQQSSSNGNQMSTQTTPNQQSPSNGNQMSTQTTSSLQSSQTTSSSNQQTTTHRPESQQIGTESTSGVPQDGSTTPSNQPDTPQGSRPCQPDRNTPIKCEKAGFFPVPGNCKKFYRCVDWDGDKNERFSVYFFECGEGTLWDPALEICNHEESVYPMRDCSSGPNNQTTSAPAPTTTTENSTTDSMESTTPRESNTTPQDESTSTRPAESTPQSTEGMTSMGMTTEGGETTPGQTEKTTESSGTSSTEPNENTSEQSSNNPTEPDGSNTTEQPTNKPTEPDDGNTTEQGNNKPTDPDDSNTTEEGNNNPTDPTTDGDNNQTNRPDGGENNSDCPALEEGQMAFVCPTGFRRHPKDCNLFYQCTISNEGDVNVMTFQCKNESVYDERKIQCLPPDETQPCPSKQNGRRRFARRIEPEMTSVVPIDTSESLCPGEGHFPYSGDCQMFFKCRKDEKGRMQGYLYQCQEKHSFSPASGRCEKFPSTERKCTRSMQLLSPTNLKWMTSKVPIEYFDVR